jgi:hypothetical protein
VTDRVQVRQIDDDEGRGLLRIVRCGTGSVVTWRRAQMVLLSAQKMPVAKVAEVTFTSPDRVRDMIHNFNADGFDSLYPKYRGGRPRTFTLPERREIKKIAKSKPAASRPREYAVAQPPLDSSKERRSRQDRPGPVSPPLVGLSAPNSLRNPQSRPSGEGERAGRSRAR